MLGISNCRAASDQSPYPTPLTSLSLRPHINGAELACLATVALSANTSSVPPPFAIVKNRPQLHLFHVKSWDDTLYVTLA